MSQLLVNKQALSMPGKEKIACMITRADSKRRLLP